MTRSQLSSPLQLLDQHYYATNKTPCKTHKCPLGLSMISMQSRSRYWRQVAPNLDAVLLIGGVPAGPQERALKAGVDIVTGTPGEGCYRAAVCSCLRRRPHLTMHLHRGQARVGIPV
jgi:hypothetical protein